MRVRTGASMNGVHLAVDRPHRLFDRALLEGLGVRRAAAPIRAGPRSLPVVACTIPPACLA